MHFRSLHILASLIPSKNKNDKKLGGIGGLLMVIISSSTKCSWTPVKGQPFFETFPRWTAESAQGIKEKWKDTVDGRNPEITS